MRDKVNLAAKLASFETPFSPKAKGEFVWHTHDDTDDFFLVLKGRLTIQLRDRDDVELGEGEL